MEKYDSTQRGSRAANSNDILSFYFIQLVVLTVLFVVLYTVNLAPEQSHIWHMLCKIYFTRILCWLHLMRIWLTMCQKNGEAYLTHVKQNMLHMWLILLHLRQLCHIVCHIWLCAGTDLQCICVPLSPLAVVYIPFPSSPVQRSLWLLKHCAIHQNALS
jgi:hypothetical protein